MTGRNKIEYNYILNENKFVLAREIKVTKNLIFRGKLHIAGIKIKFMFAWFHFCLAIEERLALIKLRTELFNHLHQIKSQKLDRLSSPQNTSDSSPESLKTVISIPENLPLSVSEQSVLSECLNCVLISKKNASDL